jgi:ubiquinone/menaquinone biosynthesis C-methylase UbiE
MKRYRPFVAFEAFAALMAAWALLSPQLASRPADEWIKTLDGPQRVAGMKIPEIVAALTLRPGQHVADIGAGSGLFEVPLAKAVGPAGRVYAVDIDAGFFPEITKRVHEGGVSNVETVLGRSTDPALPRRDIDVVLFNDVVHHIEARPAYFKTIAGYLAPGGRVAVVDFEAGKGPHPAQAELQVSREQLVGWMTDAGLAQVGDIKLFDDRYFLVFARR